MKGLQFLSGTHLQILACLAATFNAIADGMSFAWASPVVPILKSPDTPIKIVEGDVVWIETTYLIGSLIGLPITIFCVDRLGRKPTIIISAIFNLIHWVLLASCTNVPQMYVARVLSGIAADVAFISVPMYISEVADQRIRGFLASLIYVMMLFGIFLCYAIAPFVSIPVSSAVGMIPGIVQLLTLPFMPESPYYLIDKGRDEKAKRSLEKLRDGDGIDKEFAAIKAGIMRQREDRGTVKDLFMVRSNRKAVIIMTVLNAAQHFSSISVMIMNLHTILADAAAILSAPNAAIIFSLLMFATALSAGGLLDYLGRKILVAISSLLTSASLLTLALYFQFKNDGYDVMPYNWVPIAAVMLYAVMFKVGLGLVPIVLTAELFPTNVKALGMTFADAMYALFAYVAVVAYTELADAYGIHVPFYLFSGCCFAAGFFALFYIPETKGKTLDEIQFMLKGIPITRRSTVEANQSELPTIGSNTPQMA